MVCACLSCLLSASHDQEHETKVLLLTATTLQVSDAMQNNSQVEMMDAKSLRRALTAITAALKPLRPKRIRAQTDFMEGKSA